MIREKQSSGAGVRVIPHFLFLFKTVTQLVRVASNSFVLSVNLSVL